LQRELQLTTIYVTHDQSEALALSHEIAVMNEGRVVQIGAPRDIYQHPKNMFVADFVGTSNFIDAKVLDVDSTSRTCKVSSKLGNMTVQCEFGTSRNDAILVAVRPEDVELTELPGTPDADTNVCSGTVDAKVFLGEYLDFQVKVGDTMVLAKAHPSVRTPIGDTIHMRMKAEKCVAVPADSRH
jgi:iron(III) transport system ATP-binding protein